MRISHSHSERTEMGRKFGIRQAKKKNSKHMTILRKSDSTELIGNLKYPAVAELPYEDEEKWSSLDLPSPPPFNRTKFNFWSCKMKAYLWCVTVLAEVNNDEEKMPYSCISSNKPWMKVCCTKLQQRRLPRKH